MFVEIDVVLAVVRFEELVSGQSGAREDAEIQVVQNEEDFLEVEAVFLLDVLFEVVLPKLVC